MSDTLSRRGFGRIAVLGAAALWLPCVGHAQGVPRMTPRLVAWTSETRLVLQLFVRNQESRGLELLANALHLEAQSGEHPALTLRSDAVQRMRRSRRGSRIGRHLVVTANGEALYGRYGAPWRGGRGATLSVRSVLDVPASSRPADEHPGLRALAGLTGRVTVPA